MRVVPYSYKPHGSYGDCQRCGFKFRLSELSLEWTNLRVCSDCWDPRPAELTPPNVGPEGLPRPDASPEMPEVFVDWNNPVTPDDL